MKNFIKALLLVAIGVAIMVFGGNANAGFFDYEEEKTKVWTDRVTDVVVTQTTQLNYSGDYTLNLKTTSQSNGGEFRKFILSADHWFSFNKVTMKIVGGEGRYIDFDRDELSQRLGGTRTIVSTASLSNTDLTRPFGEMLEEAQKKGDVKYFIRVDGEFYKDFDYTLKVGDPIPVFFK